MMEADSMQKILQVEPTTVDGSEEIRLTTWDV